MKQLMFRASMLVCLTLSTVTSAEEPKLELLPMPAQVETIQNGDILSLYIQGVFHVDRDPPLNILRPYDMRVGYPFVVDEDGKINLPFIDPVRVTGLTAAQAQAKLYETYTTAKIIAPDKDAVFCSIIARAKDRRVQKNP